MGISNRATRLSAHCIPSQSNQLILDSRVTARSSEWLARHDTWLLRFFNMRVLSIHRKSISGLLDLCFSKSQPAETHQSPLLSTRYQVLPIKLQSSSEWAHYFGYFNSLMPRGDWEQQFDNALLMVNNDANTRPSAETCIRNIT
jgi:hypothetical protein